MDIAIAAKRTIVTCEEVVSNEFIRRDPAATTIFACLGSEIFARALARCFTDDPAGLDAATRAIRVGNAFFWTIFVNVAATTYYQAVGRPRMSIFFSLLRQCLVLLPVVWILPHFLSDPLLGVWIALPASDLVTQLVNLPYVFRERAALRRAAAAMAATAG